MLKELLSYLISLSGSNKILDAENIAPEFMLKHSDTTLVDMEKYAEHKRHYTASFVTSGIENFAEYLNSRAKELKISQSIITVSRKSLRATATFDCKDNGHCLDTAELNVQTSPEYDELKAVSHTKLQQKEIIEWIEDWNHCINDSVKIVTAFKKIEAKKIADIKSDRGDFSESNSIMESVDLINSTIPARLEFIFTPAEGLTEKTIAVRIKAHLDSAPISFSLQPIKLQLLEQEITKDFRETIVKQIPSEAENVYTGSISFQRKNSHLTAA